MDNIDNLSEYIEDEIKDAGKYAHCALKHRDENPTLAELFHRLSSEEMEHAKLLYDEAMRHVKVMIDRFSE